MFKAKLIAVTLPAIALTASLPVFADTVARYEIRSTTDGVTQLVQPGVVEYRRFSSSTVPNFVETRTITNRVIAPAPALVPTASSVRFIQTPVVAPVTERRVFINNPDPMFVESRVISQPVLIQRAPAPVVMETYNPPVVVERRHRVIHQRDRHLLDIGAPLIHLRAF